MKRKKTYTLLLIFGILCSLFLGCREIIDKAYIVKTDYINQTQHVIKVEKYFVVDRQIEKDIYTLQPAETLSFKLVIDGGCYVNDVPYPHTYAGDCQLNNSDSVVVRFNESKKLVFRREDDTSKDIYKIENFDFFKDNNTSIYTFKFTEAHYLQAK